VLHFHTQYFCGVSLHPATSLNRVIMLFRSFSTPSQKNRPPYLQNTLRDFFAVPRSPPFPPRPSALDCPEVITVTLLGSLGTPRSSSFSTFLVPGKFPLALSFCAILSESLESLICALSKDFNSKPRAPPTTQRAPCRVPPLIGL